MPVNPLVKLTHGVFRKRSMTGKSPHFYYAADLFRGTLIWLYREQAASSNAVSHAHLGGEGSECSTSSCDSYTNGSRRACYCASDSLDGCCLAHGAGPDSCG